MKIGYQLFSAREHCGDADGLRNTIIKIAAMGYDGVEFCDYAGIPAKEMRTFLADYGIEAINAHVPLDKWRKRLDEEIAYAAEAGLPMITIPWLPPEERVATVYEEIANKLPGWIEQCAKGGIKAGYHNHDFEYALINGTLGLDIIAKASPSLLLELDTFWIHYAGRDPIEEMEERKAQLALLHIKDYADKTTTPPKFCAIGHGKMANKPVIEKAVQMHIPWVIVEQDNSEIDVFESAKLSIRSINDMGLK